MGRARTQGAPAVPDPVLRRRLAGAGIALAFALGYAVSFTSQSRLLVLATILGVALLGLLGGVLVSVATALAGVALLLTVGAGSSDLGAGRGGPLGILTALVVVVAGTSGLVGSRLGRRRERQGHLEHLDEAGESDPLTGLPGPADLARIAEPAVAYQMLLIDSRIEPSARPELGERIGRAVARTASNQAAPGDLLRALEPGRLVLLVPTEDAGVLARRAVDIAAELTDTHLRSGSGTLRYADVARTRILRVRAPADLSPEALHAAAADEGLLLADTGLFARRSAEPAGAPAGPPDAISAGTRAPDTRSARPRPATGPGSAAGTAPSPAGTPDAAGADEPTVLLRNLRLSVSEELTTVLPALTAADLDPADPRINPAGIPPEAAGIPDEPAPPDAETWGR